MINNQLAIVLSSAVLIVLSSCASQAVIEVQATEASKPMYANERPLAYLLMHPEVPQLERLLSHVKLQEALASLPEDSAEYVTWLMQQQQRLSKTEQKMQALNQLNSQQQQIIQRLQAEISEKTAQLQALSDIEQKLNEQQPDAEPPEAKAIEGGNDD